MFNVIKYIDVTTEGCTGLGDVKAFLDYPACGYHDGDTILIAGWVLPVEPLNSDLQVIVRVEENQRHHDVCTDRVTRPDVFKAKLPNIDFPATAMEIGFSVQIPFNHSKTATIIIIRNGEELPWCKLKVIIDDTVTSFVNKLSQPTNIFTEEINIDIITSNTKIYYPHIFGQHHSSVVHAHLKKIRHAVSIDEFIVSLYKSESGCVSCLKSELNFEICSSKSLNDHIFLFCRDKSATEFIVHQHVTSIDGIYYPSKGIFYSFCHGSQNRLTTIVEFLLKNIDYFKSCQIKETAFLIGHGRPYHFMYDGMLGLETIHQYVNKIDDNTQFYTLESNAFIDAPKVYNRKQTADIINNKTLTRLEQDGTLFIKIGALFGSGAKDSVIYEKMQSLDKKITAYVNDIHSHSEDFIADVKKHFPIIWIGITGQKRAWLEQVEGYSNIINELYSSFPGMAVIFDGWTSSLATLQRDKVESDNDRKITYEIIQRIAPDIKIVDLVGATIDKKIYVGSFVDCAIVNYSTGSMNVSRICGRPCITHMNNSFAPARHQHIHKNAHPIPDEYVKDVIEDGSRIDSTSYHIDWEHIYDALVLHLGHQNIIKKRW